MNAHEHHHWFHVLFGLVWLLVGSGLLFLTWNKVICSFAKLKQAKYWQALLLLTTICVLCVPCHLRRHHHHHHHHADADNNGNDDRK
jgi:hypothetical protein